MQLNFNSSQYEFNSGFEPLEPGVYPCIIKDVEAERTKDSNSGLLKITLEVMPGTPNAGRQFYDRLNLWNQSLQATAIAHKQLKSLGFASGVLSAAQPVLADTDHLKNRTLMVKVGTDGQYNKVLAYMDMQGNVPGKASPQPVNGPGPAPGQGQAAFMPAGAVPAGFNPAAQQQQAAPPNPFNNPAATGGFPAQQMSAPPPPVAFPPAPWVAHPSSPGWFWNQQTNDVKSEADVRAMTQVPTGAPPNPFNNANGPQFTSPQTGAGFNPGAGFQPQGNQGGAPSGWPA